MKASETPQSVPLALKELETALVEPTASGWKGSISMAPMPEVISPRIPDIDVLIVLRSEVKLGAEITDLRKAQQCGTDDSR